MPTMARIQISRFLGGLGGAFEKTNQGFGSIGRTRGFYVQETFYKKTKN
jgi:hypothetical protein